MVESTAPGKIILFGEHAVVYGRPAIAIPIVQVRAKVTVDTGHGTGIRLVAPDLSLDKLITAKDIDDPLAAAVWQVQKATGIRRLPNMTISVTSQIPIASGLGSGAAIAAATIRAVASYIGFEHLASSAWVSALTYEVERLHHGTPSGIDNTVVTHEQPVYFQRCLPENRIETFRVATPLHLLIGDTGVRSSTKVVVTDVRRQWQANRSRLDTLFDACGRITNGARAAIERGDVVLIGQYMTENQEVLRDMSVSSPELDSLVQVALDAGAYGAKLSGAGRGGNMIALVSEARVATIRAALVDGGAKSVLVCTLT